jgi:hypothetical protein
MKTNRKEIITNLITEARKFRFCSPSEDPEEITAVASGYLHLVTRFKRLVGPYLPEPALRCLQADDGESPLAAAWTLVITFRGLQLSHRLYKRVFGVDGASSVPFSAANSSSKFCASVSIVPPSPGGSC